MALTDKIAFTFYFLVLLTGAVLSFKTRRKPWHLIIRFTTAVIALPLLLGVGLLLLLHFIDPEPPSLGQLALVFPGNRANLEAILRMSDQDVGFLRIAPGFLDRVPDTPTPGLMLSQFMAGDPKAGLPESRWNEYRRLYGLTVSKLGISRDPEGDVFIIVDSVGLLNRGHASGYLHCSTSASIDSKRFHPCLLHQDRGQRKYDPDSRAEGYSFQKLDERWFAYDEGPS